MKNDFFGCTGDALALVCNVIGIGRVQVEMVGSRTKPFTRVHIDVSVPLPSAKDSGWKETPEQSHTCYTKCVDSADTMALLLEACRLIEVHRYGGRLEWSEDCIHLSEVLWLVSVDFTMRAWVPLFSLPDGLTKDDLAKMALLVADEIQSKENAVLDFLHELAVLKHRFVTIRERMSESSSIPKGETVH